ncbi:MAG: hypothetical protein WCJ30_29695, partial [Deltaproteobacteria bacterium]
MVATTSTKPAAASAAHASGTPPSLARSRTCVGASRSRAYELSAEILERLPTLVAPRGRPPKPSPAHGPDATTLTEVVLGFVMDHPGCVDRDERRRYSDGFRHFVLEQHMRHAALDLEVFAAAVHVPLGTLKDWLRDRSAEAPPAPPSSPPPAEPTADSLHMQTVLDAWKRWDGSFLAFCEHVRVHLHVPFGRSQVRAILEVHGARRTKRRPGRTPDESALRGSFKTYFPGAQWVGDGMQVPVVVNGSRFTFNVELDVDAHSDAFVSASVRDQEDAQAVVETFDDSVATTGSPPVALLIDNRPSNHAPEVDAALGDSLRVRATPERPQNKAHIEGAFGLFSQVLPPLVIDTRRRARDLAKCILVIATTLWARTTNHRPRRSRGRRSRVELYADKPSAEQLAEARRELQELLARQERARRTLEARRRPDVLAFLDEHFARLGLLDPERHVRVAIAGHPFDAIVAGLAIFEGK